MSAENSKQYNKYSLLLFVGGFIMPIIVLIIGRFLDKSREIENPATWLGIVCELLALLFAILSWREMVSKVIVGILAVLFIGMTMLLFLAGSAPAPRVPAPVAAPATTSR